MMWMILCCLLCVLVVVLLLLFTCCYVDVFYSLLKNVDLAKLDEQLEVEFMFTDCVNTADTD